MPLDFCKAKVIMVLHVSEMCLSTPNVEFGLLTIGQTMDSYNFTVSTAL